MSTFDGPGRGRKLCAQCGAYVGVRCSNCPSCGASFAAREPGRVVEAAKTPPVVKVEETTEWRDPSLLTVDAPAGPSPVKLSATDIESVLSWADECRASFEQCGQLISTRGLIQLVRQFYTCGSPEFRTAKAILIGADEEEAP